MKKEIIIAGIAIVLISLVSVAVADVQSISAGEAGRNGHGHDDNGDEIDTIDIDIFAKEGNNDNIQILLYGSVDFNVADVVKSSITVNDVNVFIRQYEVDPVRPWYVNDDQYEDLLLVYLAEDLGIDVGEDVLIEGELTSGEAFTGSCTLSASFVIS